MDAVQSISPNCVEDAFPKAGFKFAVHDQDFAAEDDINLQELLALMRRTDCTGMTLTEFVSMDDNVHTECDDLDEIAIAETVEQAEEAESDTEGELQSQNQSQPFEPLSSYEMKMYAERIKQTALLKGNVELLNHISACQMIIEDVISNKKCKQTTIDNYFKTNW